jgi:N-acylneuraminate cytidylyltransferase
MKTIAFIPARCGSKSIYIKNIKDFCGKPLIYWSLEALEKVNAVDVIYVATDCDEIKLTVNNFKFSKVNVYDRDPENAKDHSSTEDVMLEFIKNQYLSDQDIFVLVQATSPLIESTDFSNAITFYQKENADSLLACAREKKFFWDESGRPLNYDYKDRPRRQDFKGVFWETGAFYINTVGNIKKYKNRLCGKITVYEVAPIKAVDLDEPDDWAWAENMMLKYILSKRKNRHQVKLFATDVDGVLTDGGMYYSEEGDELKKFNTRDGKGIELLRKAGIKTAILTSEDTEIVKRRGLKLKFDYIYQSVTQKLELLNTLCKKLNISLEEVAYIGDDINDLDTLRSVGFSATPADAMKQNIAVAGYVCTLGGGKGCVREFIDNIILTD